MCNIIHSQCSTECKIAPEVAHSPRVFVHGNEPANLIVKSESLSCWLVCRKTNLTLNNKCSDLVRTHFARNVPTEFAIAARVNQFNLQRILYYYIIFSLLQPYSLCCANVLLLLLIQEIYTSYIFRLIFCSLSVLLSCTLSLHASLRLVLSLYICRTPFMQNNKRKNFNSIRWQITCFDLCLHSFISHSMSYMANASTGGG